MINSILSKTLIFTVGAALGFAVTWKIVKDKYARIAEDEISAMREYFKKKKTNESLSASEEIVEIDDTEESDIEEYVDTIEEFGYSVETTEPTKFKAVPYIIQPDDFGELGDEYDLMYFTYYADGVLVDDSNDIVEKPDDVIGEGTLRYFEEEGTNALYVRDDKNKCEYEILRTTENYSGS